VALCTDENKMTTPTTTRKSCVFFFTRLDRSRVTNLDRSTGFLQLLEILEISWNLIGPRGNFCVRCRRSTTLVSSHKTGYQIAYLRNWSPYFIFATAPCCIKCISHFVLYLGKLHRYITSEAEAKQTCPGFFLKSLLESPGNLLEIFLIKLNVLIYISKRKPPICAISYDNSVPALAL